MLTIREKTAKMLGENEERKFGEVDTRKPYWRQEERRNLLGKFKQMDRELYTSKRKRSCKNNKIQEVVYNNFLKRRNT